MIRSTATFFAGLWFAGAPACPAQTPQDPSELLRLQNVTHDAIRKIAPAVVRVETFGSARRRLAREVAGADAAANNRPTPMPTGYGRKQLNELFEALDDDDLEALWEEHDLDPKDLDDPEPKTLRKLDTKTLKKLFEQHEVEPKKTPPGTKPPRQRLPAGGPAQGQGATAGIVLSADGWILVSRFALIYDPTTILITLQDGRSFHATRHGEDTSRGIALVKIEAEDLPVPTFLPAGEVRVGQWTFVVGRTFGVTEPTVHMGIVSATDRLFGRAVQIDAYTSPANYGGAVIDVQGRVLGMAVPLSPAGRNAGTDWYDSGIGFAATLTGIEGILDRLRDDEYLHRGWLGIGLDTTHMGPGAKLGPVAPQSPAKMLGLRRGDTILQVDGIDVKNSFHLQMLVSSKMAGDPARLRFGRKGEDPVDVDVLLGEIPMMELESMTKEDETAAPAGPDDEDGGEGR